MSNTSASTRLDTSAARTARVLEALAMAGLILTVLGMVLIITGPNALDIRPSVGNVDGTDAVMHVRSDVNFPVDFGDRLTWIDTEDGTRDAATGKPPVELGGPVEATLSFWSPPSSQRWIWTIRELIAPVFAAAGAWVVYQFVRSVRRGDPFTKENEQRIWTLAGLVGVGGTAGAFLSDFLKMVLIQRSAAADFFDATMTFGLLPLVGAALLGLLAGVWRLGVAMREDMEGTI